MNTPGVSMPSKIQEGLEAALAHARDNTNRIQEKIDDATRAADSDPIRKNIGRNGLRKSGVYHGTTLIEDIGGEPLDGSGFEDEQPADPCQSSS